MSKHAKSGLGSIQRDWSDTPSSSQSVEWPSSPPRSKPKLSGAAQRLKDIQDALAGKAIPSEKRSQTSSSATPTPLITSQRPNKRPGLPLDTTTAQPAKKPRQLPSSWSPPTPVPSSAESTPRPAAIPAVSSVASSSKKVAPVFLSAEQSHILRLVTEGSSVFYTGSAGTGKSVLLREIIKALRKKHAKSSDAVAITASTGIAACNIGGVTLHSFAGIGMGAENVEDLCKKIKRNKKAITRWLRTKVLIIDEVSMVDGDLFDKLSRIGSTLRKKSDPFGGLQLIVTGDFFQLPPVTTKGEPKFAFEADLWSTAIHRTFNLTKVFRQRDETFVEMLNEMRFGKLTARSIQKFRSLARPIAYDDGVEATELFPRREEVDRSNRTRMGQLSGEKHLYRANDGGTITEPTQRDKLLSNFMAPKELEVRLGAQVMLIKNYDEMLVNGSLGTIIEFSTTDDWAAYDPIEAAEKKKKSSASTLVFPVVEFLLVGGGKRKQLIQPEQWKVELPDGEVQVSRSQLPLIPAWAMSIHKSQGQTLERVKVDLGKVFEKGQAYVALSRATCLEGLQVLNFDPRKVNAHPRVVEWCRTLETLTDHQDD